MKKRTALQKIYQEKGATGVLELINQKKHIFPLNILFRIVNIILPVEKLLIHTSAFDKNIETKGFHQATINYLHDLNISLNIKSPSSPQGACLIYGNHPTGLDPYVIAAAIKRDDVYIVADMYQKQKGVNISKHIIPIIYTKNLGYLKKREILNIIGFIVMRILSPYEKERLVAEQNKLAINEALTRLKEGHVVIMFPDGGTNKTRFWFQGIGSIIQDLSQTGQAVNLMAAQISGISTQKLISHFLFNKQAFLKKNAITIELVDSLKSQDLEAYKDMNSKNITDLLRSKYDKKTLPKKSYA